VFATSCATARIGPFIPEESYLGKDGNSYEGTPLSNWITPEPDPVQPDRYNPDSISEEFVVNSENGAIAYWGNIATGEGMVMRLAQPFFTHYSPGITLGEMWFAAINFYYYFFDLDTYTRFTDLGHDWVPMATFHHPQRHVLFGDPSLRVGGILDYYDDLEAPTTSINLTDPDRWFNNGVTLELSPVDNPEVGARSGVHRTYIVVDGFKKIESRSRLFALKAGDSRVYNVFYWSEDFLDNQELPYNEIQIKIDRVLPDTVTLLDLAGDPPTIDAADFGGPVTVSVHSFDEHSGVDRIDYYLEESGGTSDVPLWQRYGSLTNPSPDPGIFSSSFTINRPGRYRVHLWAKDRAGNESGVYVSDWFTASFFDPDHLWLRDIFHVAEGPIWTGFPPAMSLPFEPDRVEFYAQPWGQNLMLIGIDTNPADGWGVQWQTKGFADDIYDIQAIAHPPTHIVGASEEASVKIPMATYALRANPLSSLTFQLDETPRVADRGEPVLHEITITHHEGLTFQNVQILFDIANGQYDTETVKILDDGKMDETNVISWKIPELKDGEVWKVRFEAAAGEGVASGDQVMGLAYLRSDEIPIFTSDDPDTPDPDDPTIFTVMAEDGTVTGSVLDALLLQPLKDANVTLAGHGSATTDENGTFLFENVVAGTYSLSASFPPLYGTAQTAVSVDGDNLTADLTLDRNDLTAPKVYLDGIFNEYVQNNITDFTGTAVDNKLGSGVVMVQAAVIRLSDGFYWSPQGWVNYNNGWWFTANGLETWSLSLPGLTFDPKQTYSLILRGTDEKLNAGTSKFYSRPPAPLNPVVNQGDTTITFSWDEVPGCEYLIVISDSPLFDEPLFYEYVDTNSYATDELSSNVTYYWLVHSRIGTNLLSIPSPEQTFTITGDPAPDIKANDSDGPVTISPDDPLSITIALDTGNMTDGNADWWVVVSTPFGWYHYDLGSGSWVLDLVVTYQGALIDLSSFEVLNMSGLPLGNYTFYFGVDMVMNGSLDMESIYYDDVDVTIEPNPTNTQ
jgi:hypothetical protein